MLCLRSLPPPAAPGPGTGLGLQPGSSRRALLSGVAGSQAAHTSQHCHLSPRERCAAQGPPCREERSAPCPGQGPAQLGTLCGPGTQEAG